MSATPATLACTAARKHLSRTPGHLEWTTIDTVVARCIQRLLLVGDETIDSLRTAHVTLMEFNLLWGWGWLDSPLEKTGMLEAIVEDELAIMHEFRNQFADCSHVRLGLPLTVAHFRLRGRLRELRARRRHHIRMLDQDTDLKSELGTPPDCLRVRVNNTKRVPGTAELLSSTLLSAGVGPTGAALSWGIIYLASQPQLQEALYAAMLAPPLPPSSSPPVECSREQIWQQQGCAQLAGFVQEVLR